MSDKSRSTDHKGKIGSIKNGKPEINIDDLPIAVTKRNDIELCDWCSEESTTMCFDCNENTCDDCLCSCAKERI